jgi:endonuclease YncB( thermonuclease family)
MRRPFRILPLLFAISAFLCAPASARNRWTGPCVERQTQPTCHFWKARIAKHRGGQPIAGIADGDTIRVKIFGRRSSAPKSVRFVGINAMELSRYSNIPGRRRGACHALEATSLVERYINEAHRIVRLGAQHPSSRTGKRLYRSVAVRRGGRWVDLGRVELERGLALWLANGAEYAHNADYHELAEEAASARRGLYDPASCGAGPSQEADLGLSVNWDADGNDTANLNDEWVRLRNRGRSDVPVGGWWLRDSFLRYNRNHVPGFQFPAATTIPAGGAIRLHMGCGKSSATELYWCQRASVFENATYGPRDMGDGAYLFDPQGDLRFSSIYPCLSMHLSIHLSPCGDPLRGAAKLGVHPSGAEYFQISNTGATPIDLDGYLLKVSLSTNPGLSMHLFTHSYDFGGNSTVGPGETLRLSVEGSPSASSRLNRYWGLSGNILPDRQGRASLRTFTDVVSACDAWGSISC